MDPNLEEDLFTGKRKVFKSLFPYFLRASVSIFLSLLLKRHFNAWKRLPDEIIREKEKEKRRQELRQKVAALLPDFEVSNSVVQSTEFL